MSDYNEREKNEQYRLLLIKEKKKETEKTFCRFT